MGWSYDSDQGWIAVLHTWPAAFSLAKPSPEHGISGTNTLPLPGLGRGAVAADFNDDGRVDLAVLTMDKTTKRITILIRE